MTGVRETKEQSSEDIPYIYCLYCTPLHYKMVGKGYVVQPFLGILAKPTCFRSAPAPVEKVAFRLFLWYGNFVQLSNVKNIYERKKV